MFERRHNVLGPTGAHHLRRLAGETAEAIIEPLPDHRFVRLPESEHRSCSYTRPQQLLRNLRSEPGSSQLARLGLGPIALGLRTDHQSGHYFPNAHLSTTRRRTRNAAESVR